LRNDHSPSPSNRTVIYLAITWSNCTIPAILLCFKLTDINTEKNLTSHLIKKEANTKRHKKQIETEKVIDTTMLVLLQAQVIYLMKM